MTKFPASSSSNTHTRTHRYGIYRSDQLIYNDPELCFKETVPLSALFDPTTNQALQPDDKDSGGSEDEEGGQGEPPSSEGAKAAKSSSNPVPLGWPKVLYLTTMMRSPTSSEDSQLVRVVVPCAQTRLPRPRGHRDAFSSSARAAQAPRVSTGLLGRPLSLERSERRYLLFVMVWW